MWYFSDLQKDEEGTFPLFRGFYIGRPGRVEMDVEQAKRPEQRDRIPKFLSLKKYFYQKFFNFKSSGSSVRHSEAHSSSPKTASAKYQPINGESQ